MRSISLVSIALFIFAFSVFSCRTNKTSEEGITFVQTERSESGKIFTTVIFESVTEIRADGASIQNDSPFSNNAQTGEIDLDSNATSFEIFGKYKNPPEFVLPENVCPAPLVLYEGKKLSEEQYEWNAEKAKISFHFKADLDADSYALFWYSTTRDLSLSNKFEKYTEYESLVSEWISKNSENENGNKK